MHYAFKKLKVPLYFVQWCDVILYLKLFYSSFHEYIIIAHTYSRNSKSHTMICFIWEVFQHLCVIVHIVQVSVWMIKRLIVKQMIWLANNTHTHMKAHAPRQWSDVTDVNLLREETSSEVKPAASVYTHTHTHTHTLNYRSAASTFSQDANQRGGGRGSRAWMGSEQDGTAEATGEAISVSFTLIIYLSSSPALRHNLQFSMQMDYSIRPPHGTIHLNIQHTQLTLPQQPPMHGHIWGALAHTNTIHNTQYTHTNNTNTNTHTTQNTIHNTQYTNTIHNTQTQSQTQYTIHNTQTQYTIHKHNHNTQTQYTIHNTQYTNTNTIQYTIHKHIHKHNTQYTNTNTNTLVSVPRSVTVLVDF